MNMTCKELKRIARENLTHHYGIPMGALLVAGIIPLAIELPFSMVQGEHPTLAQNIIFYIAEFLIALISYTLSAGVLYLHLNIARHKQYSLGMVFFPFRNRPDRFILAGLIELLIMLTGLIPVFAGIAIINYMDSPTGWLLFGILALVSFIIEILLALNLVLMVFFVIDHPDMRLWDCLRNSIHTMKGHKGKLLYIYLSFIRSTDYESVFFRHRHTLDFSLSDTDSRQFLPDSHRRNTSGTDKNHRFRTLPIVQPIYLTYRRNLV